MTLIDKAEALAARVGDFVAATGLEQPRAAPTPPTEPQHPADDPPTASPAQPDLFGECNV